MSTGALLCYMRGRVHTKDRENVFWPLCSKTSTPLTLTIDKSSIKEKTVCKLSHFSHVWLCLTKVATVIPWTVARQALLSREFSRQEYCSAWARPPPGKEKNAAPLITRLSTARIAQGICFQPSPWNPDSTVFVCFLFSSQLFITFRNTTHFIYLLFCKFAISLWWKNLNSWRAGIFICSLTYPCSKAW